MRETKSVKSKRERETETDIHTFTPFRRESDIHTDTHIERNRYAPRSLSIAVKVSVILTHYDFSDYGFSSFREMVFSRECYGFQVGCWGRTRG